MPDVLLITWTLIMVGAFADERQLYRRCGSQEDFLQENIKCSAREVDDNYLGFEKEYYRVLKSKTKHCFNYKKGKCALTKEQYNLKPLAGELYPDCDYCQGAAGYMDRNFFKADRKKKFCMNQILMAAYKRELDASMQKRYWRSFRFAKLFDYDEKASLNSRNRDAMMKSLNLAIVRSARMLDCRSQNRLRYRKTIRCLNKVKNNKRSYRRHCKAISKTCAVPISSSPFSTASESKQEECRDQMDRLHRSSCEILEKQRRKLKLNMLRVPSTIKRQFLDRYDKEELLQPEVTRKCGQKLKNMIATDTVNWADVFHEAMTQCSDEPPLFSVAQTLTLGCEEVFRLVNSGREERGKKNLHALVNFIAFMTENLMGRYSRFCPCHY